MTKLPLTPEDVNTVTDPLTRLLRVILFDMNITPERFYELHQQNFGGFFKENTKKEFSIHRNNLRREVVDDRITWNKFKVVLINLLGCHPVELSLTVRDPITKELKTYSSTQVVKLEDLHTLVPEDVDMSGFDELELSFKAPGESDIRVQSSSKPAIPTLDTTTTKSVPTRAVTVSDAGPLVHIPSVDALKGGTPTLQ